MPEYVRIRIEELAQLRDDLKSLRTLVLHERARADKYEARAEAAEEALRLAADEGMTPW